MFMKSISIVKVYATSDLMLNLPTKTHQVEVKTMTKPEPFSGVCKSEAVFLQWVALVT